MRRKFRYCTGAERASGAGGAVRPNQGAGAAHARRPRQEGDHRLVPLRVRRRQGAGAEGLGGQEREALVHRRRLLRRRLLHGDCATSDRVATVPATVPAPLFPVLSDSTPASLLTRWARPRSLGPFRPCCTPLQVGGFGGEVTGLSVHPTTVAPRRFQTPLGRQQVLRGGVSSAGSRVSPSSASCGGGRSNTRGGACSPRAALQSLYARRRRSFLLFRPKPNKHLKVCSLTPRNTWRLAP